jgi:hypothetical protein
VCSAGIRAQEAGPLPSSLTNADQAQSNQDSGQSLADLARKARKDHSEETQITAAEVKKLFSAVDRISAFASEDSGFPQRSAIKRQLVGPDEVEKSARTRMGKEDYSERMARSELTMKKFGLLPREFNLKEFLIKAQRKEIAGYYDDETKSIYLLNTIPIEKQEPILAHELTHALQDQNYDLKIWAKAGELKRDENKVHLEDEARGARRAVVEGQATVVYVDYLLAPSGRNLRNTPGLIYRMEDPMIKGSIDSEMMHDSPMILRVAGEFPYHEGLIFEGELLQAGGKKMAFAGAFADPPRTTHQVIQPRAYLEREKLPALAFPDVHAILGDNYELYDSGSIGELDVRALLWQLGSRTLADDLSKSWQGGAYVAFRQKSAVTPSTADLKVLYVSRWSSPQAAQRFAKFYVGEVSRRYQTATAVSGSPCATADCPVSSTQMATEEGPVIVQLWGDHTVVVSESFDQDTAAKLSAAVRDTGHKAQALNVSDELGMRLYDLPAFRNYQQRFREEILDSISPALATK